MITFTVTNKHRPKATIVMLVSLYGKQYKKSIGIGVPVKYWNDSKKRARTTADFKEGNKINDEIDIDFYNRFQHWFYEQGYSRNYFGNIIKIVKQVYRESRVCDRLHNEHGTDHRDFIAPKDSVDNVYLDLKELEKIYTLDIPSAVQKDAACNKAQEGENIPRKITALRRARGLFLIGCYTGLRVS